MHAVKPLAALLSISTIASMLASCSSPRQEDIPGNVPYGATELVAAAAEGGNAGDAFGGFGMSRLAQTWEPESQTLLQKPKEAVWYHYPQKSRDKLSARGGFTMVVIYDMVVWADEDSRPGNIVPLGEVTDLRNSEQGLSFATTIVPEKFLRGMRTIGENYRLPYSQGGAFTTPVANSKPAPAPTPAPAQAPASTPRK